MAQLLALLFALLAAAFVPGGASGADPSAGPRQKSAAAADPTSAIFDPARVLQVDISLNADEWDRLCAQKRTFVSLFRGACFAQPFPSPFTWYAARVTVDGETRSNAGVRKKGFLGSLDADKPSLKIDLNRFQSNATIHGTRRWTLNNAKQDPSFVRQCIGYQLFMRAGIPAPRCNFARVKVNGADLGIYVNVEEVRKPMLARHFASDEGNLYEGTASDFHVALVNTFEAQTNESNDRADLQAVINALASSDQDAYGALAARIDIDAFFRMWAMEALLGHWDGYTSNRNNFYLYGDPSSGKFHFIPWGIDTILTDGYPYASLNPAADTALFAYSAISRRLVDLPGIRARYAAEMQSLLATVWDEAAILAEIDRMEALLAPHAGDLSAATAPVRAFVAAQRTRLANALAGTAPVFPPLTIVDFCLSRTGSVSGTFVASWNAGATNRPPRPGAAELHGTIDEAPLFSTTGVAQAGADPGRPNPHLGHIDLHLSLDDGTSAILPMAVDPTRLVPGARLPIDGQAVDATLMRTDAPAPVQFLDAGSLKLGFASTKPGGRLCGTFEAGTYTFLFAILSPTSTIEAGARGIERGFASAERRHGPALGGVMSECVPGARP